MVSVKREKCRFLLIYLPLGATSLSVALRDFLSLGQVLRCVSKTPPFAPLGLLGKAKNFTATMPSPASVAEFPKAARKPSWSYTAPIAAPSRSAATPSSRFQKRAAQAKAAPRRVHARSKSSPQSISFPHALEAFSKGQGPSRDARALSTAISKILERLQFKGPVSQITHAEAARKARPHYKRPSANVVTRSSPGRSFSIGASSAGTSPKIRSSALSAPEGRTRKRVLSDAELKAVWNACAE